MINDQPYNHVAAAVLAAAQANLGLEPTDDSSADGEPTLPADAGAAQPEATAEAKGTIEVVDPTPGVVSIKAKNNWRLPSDVSVRSYNKHKLALGRLFSILSYRRSHGSPGESAFINEILLPSIQSAGYEITLYGPELPATARGGKAAEMNIVVHVPNEDGTASKTLFSCHTDTVHGWNDETLRQQLALDKTLEHVMLDKKSSAGCLGADDGAGVWLMLEMMRFHVPGTYVFHRGEERGCIGSRWMSMHKIDFLKNYNRAIAFDRKGTNDVITHQRTQQCCSLGFANALAAQLNKGNSLLEYQPSELGLYTDTANYNRVIPECTNISVGYVDAHSGNEYLDYGFVQDLCVALLDVDWDKLPTYRDPSTISYRGYNDTHGAYGSHYHGGRYSGSGWSSSGNDHGAGASASPSPAPSPASSAPSPSASPAPSPQPSSASRSVGVDVDDGPRTGKYKYKYEPTDIDVWLETSSTELLEYMPMDDEECVDLIMDLCEEIESLRARLNYRRFRNR